MTLTLRNGEYIAYWITEHTKMLPHQTVLSAFGDIAVLSHGGLGLSNGRDGPGQNSSGFTPIDLVCGYEPVFHICSHRDQV